MNMKTIFKKEIIQDGEKFLYEITTVSKGDITRYTLDILDYFEGILLRSFVCFETEEEIKAKIAEWRNENMEE